MFFVAVILTLAPFQSPSSPAEAILATNRYPAWFTEGKLGIWAHWGPQSVPMRGDWYARNMYLQDQGQYKDHLKRYGHPSKMGYKDIIPLWHAEKWDPEHLMKLYKAAGAKYFVSMGVHHDNFDLWDSKFNRWNAAHMGPKRDVVGTWQRAAKAEGLHFGVSEHLGASFNWFQVARGSDKTGPLAGIPYDGNDPRYEDLYHPKSKPGDTGWYTNDPRFQAEWSRRITDLVDHYHPDLLYSDGGFPFGSIGEALVAHFYEDSKARHGGSQEAVYTCKQPSGGKWTQDVERGVAGSIQPYPWQTDTSIGDWFYNKDWPYRHADWVIHTLVDVVSKNGNLLVNVVQRPDGSLDPAAEQVLTDMATWMIVNGESIYGTKPWVTFGEGPTVARGGAFNEDFAFSAKDIRYVRKGETTLYATMMGKAEKGEVVLKMLAKTQTASAKIKQIAVLGSVKKLGWNWKSDGLHILLPDQRYSSIATVLKISGDHLNQFVVAAPPAIVVSADEKGAFDLGADSATLDGTGIRVETREKISYIGYWDDPAGRAAWLLDVNKPGVFEVSLVVASERAGGILTIGCGGSLLKATIPTSGGWGQFQTVVVGHLTLSPRGKLRLTVRPLSGAAWIPINLRGVHLRRISSGPVGKNTGKNIFLR